MSSEWEPTASEQWLLRTKYFDNRAAIESLAQQLEEASRDNEDALYSVIRLMAKQHPPSATLDACYDLSCRFCDICNGALVEHTSRWFRRNPETSFIDLLGASPVFEAARYGARTSQDAGDLLMDPSELEHSLVSCAITGEHLAHGLRVYEVREGLLERLKLTTTKGLELDDLKLPYPTVWFQFPRGSIRFRNINNTLFDLTGVFLREYTRKGRKCIDLAFYGRRSFSDQPEALITTLQTPLTVDWVQNIASIDHLSLDGKVIRTAGGDDTAWSFDGFLGTFWELLVNVIMYATWPVEGTVEEVEHNPEVRKLKEQLKKHPAGYKRQRTADKLRKAMPHRRFVLGANVDATSEAEGSPLETRTLVHGHWQRFRVGPGRPNERTDIKWRYRAPFWRGPQDAPESNKRHLLG